MPTKADMPKSEDTTEKKPLSEENPQANEPANEDAVIGLAIAKPFMHVAKYGSAITAAASDAKSKAIKRFDENYPNARTSPYEALTHAPSIGLDTIGMAYNGAISTFNLTYQKAIPAVVTNTAKYGLLYPAKYGVVLPAVLFDEAFPKTSNVIKKTPGTIFNVATSGTATAFDTVIAAPYLFVKDDVITPAIDKAAVQPAKRFIKNNPAVFSVFKRDPSAAPGPLQQRAKESAQALWDVLPFEAPSAKYPKAYAVSKVGYDIAKTGIGAVAGAAGATVKAGFKYGVAPLAVGTGKYVLAPTIKFAANDLAGPAFDYGIRKPAQAFDRTFPNVSSRLQSGFKELKNRSTKITTNAVALPVAASILTVKAAFGIFDLALDWAWKRPSKAFSKWKPETAKATENVYNAYQGTFKKVPYPATVLLIPALGIPALYTTYWGTMGTKALLAAQMGGEAVAAPGLKMTAYTFGPKLAKVALFKPVLSMGKTTKDGFFNSNLYNQHLKVGYEEYIDPGIQKSLKMVQDVDDWVEEAIPSYKEIKEMLKPDEDGIKARAKRWANDVKPSVMAAFKHASDTLRVRPKPEIPAIEHKEEIGLTADSVQTEPSALDDATTQKDWDKVAAAPASQEVEPAKAASLEEEQPKAQDNTASL